MLYCCAACLCVCLTPAPGPRTQSSYISSPPPPFYREYVRVQDIKPVLKWSGYEIGFGGLSAAIECRRQGHDVAIYESFPELKQLGDIITFGSNAGRIFARWGDGLVTQRFRPLCLDTLAGVAPGAPARGNYIHKWDTGEVVFHQPPVPYDPQAPYFSGHRGELHEVVFKYARDDLGIPIHLGRKVEDYFENEAEAGIVLENGEKVRLFVCLFGIGSTPDWWTVRDFFQADHGTCRSLGTLS